MTSRGMVLVTGASGTLGAVVCRELRRQGMVVRALVHVRASPEADEAVQGDLATGEGLERAVAGVTTVAHLAALTHSRRVEDYRRVNANGTSRLIDAARAAGVTRFVYASTHAISPAGGDYSKSKLLGEQAVERAELEHVIVRLPEVYGAAGAEGVDRIIDRARRGAPIPIPGDGEYEVRPILVDEAAGALAAAVTAAPARGRTYTLAGDRRTLVSFAALCVEEFGGRSRIVHVPEWAVATACVLARVLPLPVYPDQLARLRAPRPAPSDDAFDDLGFRPLALREGLRQLAGADAGTAQNLPKVAR